MTIQKMYYSELIILYRKQEQSVNGGSAITHNVLCLLLHSVGTSIKLDAVRKLVELLAPIQHKYREIALALDVPDHVHETSSKYDILKLKDVLNNWIERKGTDATPEALVAAIKGPIVQNNVIGNEINSFFSAENTSIIGGKLCI